MELLVSACGLLCNKCPAYVAEQNNDAELAEKTASEWSAIYGVPVTINDVWCTGCMTEGGRKSTHCGSHCEIRKCVQKRENATCAHCAERPDCATLAPVLEMAPPAGQLLDALEAFRKQFTSEK